MVSNERKQKGMSLLAPRLPRGVSTRLLTRFLCTAQLTVLTCCASRPPAPANPPAAHEVTTTTATTSAPTPAPNASSVELEPAVAPDRVAPDTVAPNAALDPRIEACSLAVQTCAGHARAWNVAGMVDCMAEEVLVATFVTRQRAMDAFSAEAIDPASIVDAQAATPTQLHTAQGARVYAIVPQRVVMRRPEGRFGLDSYLIAVSSDDGRTWKFVDGTRLTPAIVTMLFPDFPSGIELPVVGSPTVAPKSGAP
jgi:hypothetical protein